MSCSSESSASPPPSSPLPVSVGPGFHRYVLSSSTSPSPPFSPPPTSTENLPLPNDNKSISTAVLTPFSLDYGFPDESHSKSSSCLKDLLLFLLFKCCGRRYPSLWEPHPNQPIKHY